MLLLFPDAFLQDFQVLPKLYLLTLLYLPDATGNINDSLEYVN